MEIVELKDIMYILAIYEEKSFCRAAAKYYISQPALSKIVKKAERILGVTIFNRTSIPISVTAEGEPVIRMFLDMRGLWDDLSEYCENTRRRQCAAVTVGAPSYFCTYVLPALVSAFYVDCRDVSIKPIETNDVELRQLLAAGRVDIGISVEGDDAPGLESIPLQNERIILAVPKKFHVNAKLRGMAIPDGVNCDGLCDWGKIPAVSMEHFAGEPFLLLRRGADLHRRSLKICRDAGFAPDAVMECDQLLTAYRLAESGEGIAFTRASVLYYIGFSEHLYYYKIDHPDAMRRVYLLRKAGRGHRASEELFVNFIKDNPMPN